MYKRKCTTQLCCNYGKTVNVSFKTKSSKDPNEILFVSVFQLAGDVAKNNYRDIHFPIPMMNSIKNKSMKTANFCFSPISYITWAKDIFTISHFNLCNKLNSY